MRKMRKEIPREGVFPGVIRVEWALSLGLASPSSSHSVYLPDSGSGGGYALLLPSAFLRQRKRKMHSLGPHAVESQPSGKKLSSKLTWLCSTQFPCEFCNSSLWNRPQEGKEPRRGRGSSCRHIHSVFIGQVLVLSCLLGKKRCYLKKKILPQSHHQSHHGVICGAEAISIYS